MQKITKQRGKYEVLGLIEWMDEIKPMRNGDEGMHGNYLLSHKYNIILLQVRVATLD